MKVKKQLRGKLLIQRNKKVVSMHKKGMDTQDILKTMDIGIETFRNIMKKEGISTLNERKEKQLKKITGYYKKGKSIQEIAGLMNLSDERTRQILKKTSFYKGFNTLTKEEKKKFNKNIRHDVLSGLSIEKLSKKYGYSIKTLENKLGKLKLPTPYTVARLKRDKSILADVKSGKSPQRIADKYKIRRTYVFQLCVKNGYRHKVIRRNLIKKLSKAGYSVEYIAEQLNIGLEGVRYHLRVIKKEKNRNYLTGKK